ncbi:MAG: hypothetical protein A3I89_03255 [Candidatus Harrisonbacteria bacterium RIFCSPLOWO2_02_FULL_41_11]|uniref:Uncharacterized protein n=1 Tax=Candidatus Harrisonbacteria bacterium RIFCSPHIGHO2_02_FULL_42_16 TaxID=1798404 RepID=A0A1G1ZIN0_9BACT|nr:MAG: hypothetical protein A3B92_02745 [Candidatus Harrisonbacteria bacterium RIFCSPHIGHO2_02_FULL_42_16]OGY66256.1 MAG: hypothetical protein A3I89_03255 [Candidatus Harrisonbacteria bacterium RIFCSPLOWO2_02_FULL_41_11]
MSTATLEKKLKKVERELRGVKEAQDKLAKFITFTSNLPEETLDEYKNHKEIRRAILNAQR